MAHTLGWRLTVGLVGLWLAVSLHSAAASSPFIYFTANLTPQSNPAAVTPLERALLEQIASATATIDAALYEFDRLSLRDALLAADARGVRVRIVTDNQTHASADDWPIYQALDDAGIEIVDDSGLAEDLRIHDKYLIIDGQRVWTGSGNLTTADLTSNHNNALLLASPVVAQMFQHDFDQLWARRFGTAKSASPITQTTYGGHPLQVYFSPQDAPLDRIINAVAKAQVSIDFAILQFKDDSLRDAVLAAQARGVRVRGLLDAGSADDEESDDESLCAGGVALKIEGTDASQTDVDRCRRGRRTGHHRLAQLDCRRAYSQQRKYSRFARSRRGADLCRRIWDILGNRPLAISMQRSPAAQHKRLALSALGQALTDRSRIKALVEEIAKIYV